MSEAPLQEQATVQRSPRSSWRDASLLGAFFASGVAALGLELVWVRVLGLAFGSESVGMLAVLAAFFGGLALGSAALHRFVTRSASPIRIYAAAECVIAAYAIVGPTLMLRLAAAVPRVLGQVVGDNRSLAALSINITIAMLVLLPATVSMGATTVALVEAWQRQRTPAENATTVALLYAANTFGATIGIVVVTYWLMPVVGLTMASGILAACSLAAAALALAWARAFRESPDELLASALLRSSALAPVPSLSQNSLEAPWLLYSLLFFTGLAGVGLEAVGTRVLAQIFENTVYTFANVLAVYLLGTATGAWLYAQKLVRRFAANRDRCTSWLLYGLAVTGIFSAAVLGRADALLSLLAPAGATYARLVLAQTAVSGLVFFPLTIWMGATFSHLVGYFTSSGVGYASALNTFGATIAPFVFGLLLIPSGGFAVAFYGAVGIYVLLFLLVQTSRRQQLQQGRWAFLAACVVAAAAIQTYSPLILVRFPANIQVLEQQVGVDGVVTVTEASGPNAPPTPPRFLQVGRSYFMGGTPGAIEHRMGNLSLLLGRAPRDVLFLGLGTGITAGAALGFPVERVTAVDLLPEIVNLLPWFSPFNAGIQSDPRVTLHASDARRFVQASRSSYDAIVADLYHPSRDGTASLYTKEHFLAIRSHLREGGVFVQWLPLYQMSPRDLKTIVRTFLDVFPGSHSMIGNYSIRATFGLVGSASNHGESPRLDITRAEALLERLKGSNAAFEGLPDLFGTYMLGAENLRRYAGSGPLNTDDNQRVTFDAAPASGIQGSPDFYLTLASVLPYREPFLDEFVGTANPTDLVALRRGVAPYGEAATHYLAAEVLLQGANGKELPDDAIAEYMTAYATDVRFTSTARRVLILTIQQPLMTKQIVERLWLAHPEQPDLARLRFALSGLNEPAQIRTTLIRFLQSGASRP